MAEETTGILIDPFARVVVEMEVDQTMVGALIGAKQGLEARVVDEDNHMILDAEGNGVEGQKFWRFKGSPVVCAGKGLIMGTGENGNTIVDCSLDVHDLSIEWLDLRFVGVKRIDCGLVETPQGPAYQIWLMPEYEDLAPPAPPPTKPVTFWTIYQREGFYEAILRVAEDGKMVQRGTVQNADLDELRGMLSPGMVSLPLTAGDEPSIVESWLVQQKD